MQINKKDNQMSQQEIKVYQQDNTVRNANIYVFTITALVVVGMLVAMQYAGVR